MSKLNPLNDINRIIHEPSRLLIISILANVESVDFLFMQKETELTKGNLSSHLSRLEKADYIKIEKTYQGKKPLTLIKITEKGESVFLDYTTKINSFMKQLKKDRKQRSKEAKNESNN